ncbi:hypothetical protein DL240_01655 [Lujinxingia litoralis]|uniref:Uncharacterized protein n=1 Tax=Lujinxingia litoralis TaxID=2211119 RepID=A0A328CCJ3_9DELT|nr:hypothetical protein [Lujinxingia litoralis]RAL24941.1 hypothetical protein DL240_01655 [Lujinxingia litoralis]
MPQLPTRQLAMLLLLALPALSTACKNARRAPSLTEDQVAEYTRDQPEVFVPRGGAIGFDQFETLHLGMEQAPAMAELERICGKLEVFEGGWRHKEASFHGCVIENDDGTQTVIRGGFWPFNDNRLSTLELKSRNLGAGLVRARFMQVAGPLTEDLPRRGTLMMASERYRLFANWDEGGQGPTHLTIGYEPTLFE